MTGLIVDLTELGSYDFIATAFIVCKGKLCVTRVNYLTSVSYPLFKSSKSNATNKLEPRSFSIQPRATKQNTVKAKKVHFTKRSHSPHFSLSSSARQPLVTFLVYFKAS